MKAWWAACGWGWALLWGLGAWAGPEGAGVVVAYDFAGARERLGWQANGDLRDVRLTVEGLACRAVGSDPILELPTRLEVPARAWQVVEIRLRADRDGVAELFWSPTDQGPYGGFSQERALRFPVRGGAEFRTYRLRPFWHPDRRLVRLRLDLYDGTAFVLASLRVLEGPEAGAAREPVFDFGAGAPPWEVREGAEAFRTESGMRVEGSAERGRVFAPPVEFEAAARPFVSFRMAVDGGRRGTLFFATAAESGLHSLSFPLQPDGGEHTYNLDMLASAAWRGRVIALGLQPSDTPGVRASIRWFRASPQPAGAPDLRVMSLAADEARPRAGRPVRWLVRLGNAGGETASNLVAMLKLPEGLRTRAGAERVERARLAFGEETEWAWELEGREPGNYALEIEVRADGVTPIRRGGSLELGPTWSAPPAGEALAAPRPVRGPYEVGAYYFPGWRTAGPWESIRRFPERRPVLGWYREGDPEVADWHIRWAVEHGITFFAYDWYWSRGTRQLEHALHDGYLRARHRDLLKFCLLWANHNAPGTSSFDDCLEVTRYWIDHYFRLPQHLRLGGKPVVIIFSPDRLTADLGAGGVKRALSAMREECARAGLGGLVVLACVADVGGARQCAAEGYDAVTAYTWPHLGVPEGELQAPFESLLEGYRRNWTHLAESAGIPLLPPVCGGWDSRPWHGENQWVRHGRTPDLFRRHLQDAREFLDARVGPAGGASPVLPLVLVEAWNEFGEGAYIEPHREFGFGYLDAIRDVFGGPDGRRPHEDLVPADVGAGPFEVPPPGPARTAWTFDRDDEGWDNLMDLADAHVDGGVLVARTTGNDAALFGPSMQARAEDFGRVRLRLRLSALEGAGFEDRAQLFWRTVTLPESEAASVRFPVAVDGEWHDYVVAVGGHARWRGVITRLRFDPVNRRGVRVECDGLSLGP